MFLNLPNPSTVLHPPPIHVGLLGQNPWLGIVINSAVLLAPLTDGKGWNGGFYSASRVHLLYITLQIQSASGRRQKTWAYWSSAQIGMSSIGMFALDLMNRWMTDCLRKWRNNDINIPLAERYCFALFQSVIFTAIVIAQPASANQGLVCKCQRRQKFYESGAWLIVHVQSSKGGCVRLFNGKRFINGAFLKKKWLII